MTKAYGKPSPRKRSLSPAKKSENNNRSNKNKGNNNGKGSDNSNNNRDEGIAIAVMQVENGGGQHRLDYHPAHGLKTRIFDWFFLLCLLFAMGLITTMLIPYKKYSLVIVSIGFLIVDVFVLGLFAHYLFFVYEGEVHVGTISEFCRSNSTMEHKMLLLLCMLTSNCLLLVHIQNFIEGDDAEDFFAVMAIVGDLSLIFTGVFPTVNTDEDQRNGTVGVYWGRLVHHGYGLKQRTLFSAAMARSLHLGGVVFFIISNIVYIMVDSQCVINFLSASACIFLFLVFGVIKGTHELLLFLGYMHKEKHQKQNTTLFKTTIMLEFLLVLVTSILAWVIGIGKNDYIGLDLDVCEKAEHLYSMLTLRSL